MTFGSLLVCPAAAASAAPRCASARVMSWNFLLPSLLKPSWTNALPSLGWVPTWALIPESLRSPPLASGTGSEARNGKYLKRYQFFPEGSCEPGQPFVGEATHLTTV